MKIYRISKCAYIDDLSGTGAASFPGRWHNKGTYILYTAASPSLALLESVVHITTIVKLELCIIGLEIPGTSIQEVFREQLPEGWFRNPPPDQLKNIGDQFVEEGQFLALKVPSAVMQEEYNYLLNPAHPDFESVKVVYSRHLHLDQRLLAQQK
ncbi:RES family NAD+ phosphorylase [Niabella drilacis]|uniref:RES domain-containing protein n=1 Tax=Niabella drilacis (strain DSM 25811 / CCM 8410 / CCUG 62505 / LMG 26954 / E90) TaxID=1285928 RepID=A0A1G6SI26_NIADE|nr:RES family NAD+ phosphorylase [Niabella drilacis]SDD16498.1 RES domain-containing protein [Niabella drilacis]